LPTFSERSFQERTQDLRFAVLCVTVVAEKPLSSKSLFKTALIETNQVSLGLTATDQVRVSMAGQAHHSQMDWIFDILCNFNDTKGSK